MIKSFETFNGDVKIKNFTRFNESSQDIDWDKFQDFLKRDGNFPEIVENYQIDKGEIGDLLYDIEDNMDLKYSVSQNFQISMDRKIRHNLRIILMITPPKKFISTTNPSDQLYNLNIFQSILLEVESLVKSINSFFSMVLRNYKYPEMGSSLNFILDFSREIDDLELVKKLYLEYLNKSKKEMAKKVLSEIVDHLRYSDADTFSIINDPNEVRVEYCQGGNDTGCPGGFHIFIGGDMVTRQSLERNADIKSPFSYVDWDFVNTKFGLV